MLQNSYIPADGAPVANQGARENWKDWSEKLKSFIAACSEEMLKLVEEDLSPTAN